MKLLGRTVAFLGFIDSALVGPGLQSFFPVFKLKWYVLSRIRLEKFLQLLLDGPVIKD